MSHQYYLEREIFNSILIIRGYLTQCEASFCERLREKQKQLKVAIPQDLKRQIRNAKCQTENSKSYSCKICDKVFNDGRQLGGHISRTHKNNKSQVRKKQQYDYDDVSSSQGISLKLKGIKKESGKLKVMQKKKLRIRFKNLRKQFISSSEQEQTIKQNNCDAYQQDMEGDQEIYEEPIQITNIAYPCSKPKMVGQGNQFQTRI